MFLYTTTLDSVGRGISYESSRRANVLHARASTFVAKEQNQTLGRIPPPSLQRGDGASTNTRGYGTLKCARARLFRQKAPPFRRAPSSLHVQGPNKRPTPFPGLKDRGVAMTCPTSKGSDRSSSYSTLHSMPFIWRPRFGEDTASHVVCPRSTCKKANVFAKEPPTSIVARHFRDRTCVRSVFDGMRIAHGFFGQCRYRSNSWRCLVGFRGSLLTFPRPKTKRGIATHACAPRQVFDETRERCCRFTPR